MRASRIFEKTLLWLLLAIFASVVPSAIIRYVTSPRSPQEEVARQEEKYKSVNQAKFRSLFDAGTRAIRDAQYSQALDSFREAERSTDQPTPDQYASLKKSRQEIARLCEASGCNSEAEGAYADLVNSALREGDRLEAGQPAAALAEYESAEQFSQHLTATKQSSLLQVRRKIAYCLSGMHRYPEAVQTTQLMIDDLRATAGEYDPRLTSLYLQLAETYSHENDWKDTERATMFASQSCDNIIERFHQDRGEEAVGLVGGAISDKGIAMHWLEIAYWREGNTDLALSTADDYFNYKLEPAGGWGVIRLYPQKDVANLALQIATEANRQDAIDLWRQRLNNLHE